MKIAFLSAVATLRAATKNAMGTVAVDTKEGIIRGVSVCTVGPAKGHGFSIDETTLEQLCDLCMSAADGVKMHLAHPTQQADGSLADQVGAIVGRLKNFRIEGATLRGDAYLGDYAEKLPGLGDVKSYLLSLAESDPGAMGLSVVFTYDLEPVVGRSGQPERLVARVSKVIQVDFVGDPAANPNGLLAAGDGETTDPAPAPPPETPIAEPIADALATLISAATACTSALRVMRDAWASMAASSGGYDGLSNACVDAGEAAQELTFACREATDEANEIRQGSLSDLAISEAATIAIRTLCVFSDEGSDGLDLLSTMRYGSFEGAEEFSLAAALIQTALATADGCVNAIRPLTEPISAAVRAISGAVDAIAPLDASLKARGLVTRCVMLGRSGRDAIREIRELRSLSPEAEKLLVQHFPNIVTPEAGRSMNRPTLAALAEDTNPGRTLTKYLWAAHPLIRFRSMGSGKLALFGVPGVMKAAMAGDVEEALTTYDWQTREAMRFEMAGHFARMATNDPENAGDNFLAALGWAPNHEGARSYFNGPASPVSLRAALAKVVSPDDRRAFPTGVDVVMF